MPQQIIGQALGIIGTILTFVSYQAKTKRSLLIIQSSATLCICISYLLLGATAGFALTVVSLVRNAIFYMQKEKTLKAYGKNLFVFFLQLFLNLKIISK